ncbi:Mitochondrial chaperone BCS1 [Hypsizygus marmoreus]|uniref:Mitochondrial chaperone BCS1 n=1 Tax=Hypsizygus marmoreus TaxID=39966 RepID=A0A369JJG9_HYPMA|nr:Mitochondrial chaperone BCS1 [Hypsizygus marmoreus]
MASNTNPEVLLEKVAPISSSSPHIALPNVEQTGATSFLGGFLENNPYFQAGFGLMSLGVGLTVLRQGLVLGTTTLRRRMLVTLEINNKDRSYEWFLAWMAYQTNATASAKTSLRSAPWIRSHQLSVETMIEQRKNGSSSALFKLVAGPGTHYFKYRGAWMQVKRERETRSMQLMSGVPWETVTLTTLSRDRELFPQLLSEARDLAMRGHEGKLVIHTAWGIEWKPFGQPRIKRPLQSVVLEPGVGEKIERDIKSFLDRRQWYADRGIPYRRGYLLHGPPGSGKTSFIQALAGSLSYDICLLNLSERGLADDKLNHLLSNAPERSFVLIEDVDAAFNKRVQTSEDGYQSSVTFSGFLNALDGVASGEERIIFMTTNHVEKLDPALIRPGRVDMAELIDDSSSMQAKTLFTRFYGGGEELPEQEVQSLADTLEKIVEEEKNAGRRVSMAALQGLFIRHNAKEAIAGCRDLFVDRRTP